MSLDTQGDTVTIVITGGAGFLGARLARTLLRGADFDTLSFVEQRSQQIRRPSANNPSNSTPPLRLVLVDRVAAPDDLTADPRVRSVVGDLNELLADPTQRARAVPLQTDAIVHLAAAVSAECEADFDLGLRSNIDATRNLLQAARELGTAPVFVYASSLAVFGFGAGLPRPSVIDDFSLPTPQGSYGVQKFIGEQLVADFARKGFVRGRSVRPMTVSVRPGKPNGAASGFLSGMIREPMTGVRATVPVSPDMAVALASPANTVAGLIKALSSTDEAWGPRTAMNLPSIQTTVGEMAQALRTVAGQSAFDLLDWTPDAHIERLVGSWPAKLSFDRAQALGLSSDGSFEDIVRAHLSDMAAQL